MPSCSLANKIYTLKTIWIEVYSYVTKIATLGWSIGPRESILSVMAIQLLQRPGSAIEGSLFASHSDSIKRCILQESVQIDEINCTGIFGSGSCREIVLLYLIDCVVDDQCLTELTKDNIVQPNTHEWLRSYDCPLTAPNADLQIHLSVRWKSKCQIWFIFSCVQYNERGEGDSTTAMRKRSTITKPIMRCE